MDTATATATKSNDKTTALLLVSLVILAIAVIASYLYPYFSFKNPPASQVGDRGPVGPPGLPGKNGYAINEGPTGATGPNGTNTLIYSYTLSDIGRANEDYILFPWNYTQNQDILIYAAKIPRFLNNDFPLSVVFYGSAIIYGYNLPYENESYLDLNRYIQPSTKSSAAGGGDRTSNYGGFDYTVIHTLPSSPSYNYNGIFYSLEYDTTYILLYINMLESTYTVRYDLGTGGLIKKNSLQINGNFIFSFYHVLL